MERGQAFKRLVQALLSRERREDLFGLRKTLAGLCALPGPSGFEGQAARAALELLRPLVDEAFLDRMGSVVGGCGAAAGRGAKRCCWTPTLDEIGFSHHRA